jgi:hypothetical protein
MGYAVYDSSLFPDDKAFIEHLDTAMYAQKRSKLGNRG